MSRSATWLLSAVFALVVLGVVMIYSASAIYALHVYGDPHFFLVRQTVYAVLGSVAMFFTASVPVAFWKKHARAIMLLAILMLLVVYLPMLGKTAGGARRWIRLGVVNFQPVEFAKIAVCLYLSDYLARKRKFIKKGKGSVFIPPLALVGLVCGLALIQPDLGSSAFIFLITCVLFFWAGIRLYYVLIAFFAFLPFFYFLIVRVPYRLSRVTAYLNPWDDPQGSGFQIIQSFLAYGVGGVQGAGLGRGIQKLFYLPSAHNDFIFSIIGEELGILGILLIMALFGIIFLSGLQMADRATQDYEKLLIVSITLMIVLQALIHMLVATGLIPTKGLPLPFVSYGGTSIVFSFMSVGLLLGMDRATRGSVRRR
ncbi:MAG: cell division protein FtsW [Omnitrophica bacterium GWA2_52_8]|nr:MAG: cell division protein FtsW [Omnitrophica bacterium GWA2_52_8]